MKTFRHWCRFTLLLAAASSFLVASACGTDEPEPPQAAAEEAVDTMRLMNEAAEGAYFSLQRGDLDEAKTRVAQLSVLSAKLSYDGIATAEGIEAVVGTITAAMRAMNAVSPDAQTVTLKVAGARLAVDALSHREQPMWLEMRGTLQADLDKMAEAAEREDDPAASAALASWRGHAELVRPAIIISRGGAEAVKLDSMTAFLTNGLRSADWGGLRQAVPNLKSALGELFDAESRETTSPLVPTAEPPHPVIWSLGLGAFIVAVLSYVAWRRYTADQGIARVKSERDFDGRS